MFNQQFMELFHQINLEKAFKVADARYRLGKESVFASRIIIWDSEEVHYHLESVFRLSMYPQIFQQLKDDTRERIRGKFCLR